MNVHGQVSFLSLCLVAVDYSNCESKRKDKDNSILSSFLFIFHWPEVNIDLARKIKEKRK
jgi:hypothetical protein